MKLRDYQERALLACRQAFRSSRSVLLVAPTGSGKTVMGAEVARRTLERRPEGAVLWICHRAELRDQASRSLAEIVRRGDGGAEPRPWRVETVQTLLARDERPPATLIVYDEAHHYRAEQWGGVAAAYPSAWSLGLTATPQRADGKGLGSVFGEMAVASSYSELVAGGHLVPCRTLRPDRYLGSDGIAQDSVGSYLKHGEERPALFFVPPGSDPASVVDRLRAEGVAAAQVTAKTPSEERARAVADFRQGKLRALVNIYCLTEGVDVPAASCCVLARGVGHASQYLQIVGRIMRPAPGKKDGLLIDLSGASHLHGLPGADVRYSLDGDGIETQGSRAARSAAAAAPGPPKEIKIYSLALRAVYAGEETPEPAREAEWVRLAGVAAQRGWGLSWAAKEYRQLFGVKPPYLRDVPVAARRGEYRKLLAWARSRGHKDGAAGHRYKSLFGEWPRRSWRV